MIKSGAKRKWLILVFTILILAASLFVWWMSSSNFKGSYKEIKQQYYSVVADQVVNELEASIKYGKSLDSFYNISGIFEKLTTLLPSHIKAAITRSSGEILYTSFDNETDKNGYIRVLQNSNISAKLKSITENQTYAVIEQDNYDIMILPIYDKGGDTIGSFTLMYPAAAINSELEPQRMENLKISLLVLIIPVLLLFLFFCFIPMPEEEEKGAKENAQEASDENAQEDSKKDGGRNKRRNLMLNVVPALIVMVSIGVQSTIMYDQYKVKYKSAISDGASGILNYLEVSVNTMHQKGIPYEKMSGLTEYLTEKAKDTPIIWNIRIYKSIADTGETLKRENSWVISVPLTHEADGDNTQVEIQISQEYMNQKMMNMLLVFLVTMIVAAVIIFEVMRLPDILMFRRSSSFNTGSFMQYEKITSGIRIISFIIFMGVYSSMPFSAILMRQWNVKIFGLSTDVSASLPMTLELLSVMLFSILFARLFKKSGQKVLVLSSGICMIAGNALCALVAGPGDIILFRILCGAGFAGLKHGLNTIISSGSEGEERTSLNIAGMNAGLLGGIMCGGSLGAVIANSMGISLTYLFTAGLLLVSIALVLYIIPWKLLKQKIKDVASREKTASKGMMQVLFKGNVLKYLLMVTLPLNVGLMFIVAFIPGYVQKLELPVILISYGYLVNGLVGIYLGPALSRLLTKKMGRTMSVSLMLVMGAIAILILGIQPSIAVILLSTALMGLFDGFGSPVSIDYFIEMPEIKKKVDISSSLAFLGVVGNATQMISPMFYGWLMLMSTSADFNILLMLGAGYLMFALVFLITGKKQLVNTKASG